MSIKKSQTKRTERSGTQNDEFEFKIVSESSFKSFKLYKIARNMNLTQVEYVTLRSYTYTPIRHTDAKDAEHTTVATAMIQNAHATTLYRNLSAIPISIR